MHPRRFVLFPALALVLTLVVACGGAGAASESTTARSGVDSAATVLTRGGCVTVGDQQHKQSAPGASTRNGPVVLTVTGRFPTGVASRHTLSLADLDALPQVQCSIDDRIATGRQVVFRGPLLSTVLSSIGAGPAATLHVAALNDYAVDLPSSDIATLPVLLATAADGRPMSVANYGPLRIIYPTTGFNLDPIVYDPRRIWQLSSIDAR